MTIVSHFSKHSAKKHIRRVEWFKLFKHTSDRRFHILATVENALQAADMPNDKSR